MQRLFRILATPFWLSTVDSNQEPRTNSQLTLDAGLPRVRLAASCAFLNSTVSCETSLRSENATMGAFVESHEALARETLSQLDA